jgi:hypothetical protein
MSSHVPFTLRLQLASSVIVGRRLTLDALLAALIFERTGDPDEAHSTIPLSRPGGVWAGSAALLEGPAPVRPVSVIQALKARLDVTPDMVRPGKRGYPRVEEARGPYRNRMTDYKAYDAAAVWFTGTGDIDRVRELVEHVPGVGAKRTSGYGRVESVILRRGGTDAAGIAFADGSPARPVPLDAWQARGGARADTALEACRPPYWDGTRVLCALPTHTVVTRRDARALVGLA